MDSQVRFQLGIFETVTPSGASDVWGEFKQVCFKYFERGADFNQLLNDALMGQMFDVLLQNLTVEEKEKLPPITRSVPYYYWDVALIFRSPYPFSEMLDTSKGVFGSAWVMEGGGGAAGPSAGGGVWKNAYIESWTALIEGAQSDEEGMLNEIKDYALRAYEPWSFPLLYKELGKRYLRYGNHCYELLVRTFVDHNWQWVYEVFDMAIKEPEIIKEWQENEK